jgi:hypothetical protein
MTRKNKDNDFFSEATKLTARDKALHDCSADHRGLCNFKGVLPKHV